MGTWKITFKKMLILLTVVLMMFPEMTHIRLDTNRHW